MISLHTQRFNFLLDFVCQCAWVLFFFCFVRIANAYNPEMYNHNHTRLSFILNYIFLPPLLPLVRFIFCVCFSTEIKSRTNVWRSRGGERGRGNAARKRQTIRKVYLDVEGLKVLSLLYIRRFYLVSKSDQIKCEPLQFGAHTERDREGYSHRMYTWTCTQAPLRKIHRY